MLNNTADIIKAIKSYMELERESGMDSYIFEDAPDSLEALKDEVSRCAACDLYKTRRNVVFGSGNPKASLIQ